MAVEFTAEHTRESIYKFDPADIVINENLNGRYSEPDIDELVESILKRGQLQPVIVRAEGGKPVLIAGHRRWVAISKINREELWRDAYPKPFALKCIYHRANLNKSLAATWEENHCRVQTTALDDGHYFAQLVNMGMDVQEIAETLGVTVKAVNKGIALATADPALQGAVSAGRVTPTAAARISREKDAHAQQRAAEGNGAAVKKPNLKAVRERLMESTGPGEKTAVREFVEAFIKWMDGEAE